MNARLFLLFQAAAAILLAADPQNMGGTWILNVDKSDWGKRDKPTNIELNIEHREPDIRYHGAVVNANATDRREFKFEGRIDGQPHPAEGPGGSGTMTIKRINPFATSWTYRSSDGKVTEDSTVSISRDARELSRRIHRKGPEGDFIWTEVYQKR